MEISPLHHANVAISEHYGIEDHNVNLMGRGTSRQKLRVGKEVICFIAGFQM